MVYKLERRPSKKAALLQAAAQLVADKGFEALTIDGLAKAAGVTKGGVQYHFASKDQLITDLLEHALSSFNALLPTSPGPDWLLAYIDALTTDSVFDAAVIAMLAALPPGDARVSPFDHYAEKWKSRAEASLKDPALGQIICLAADGLWLERSSTPKPARSDAAIIERLKQLVREHS